jgi:hypothetical protein
VAGRLVEFPLEGGDSVVVEVADTTPGDGAVMRGLGRDGLVEQTEHTFEHAIGRIQPAASALIQKLRSLPEAPDEVNVEFGLELSAEAGAFIASASTAANFKVSLTWRRSG